MRFLVIWNSNYLTLKPLISVYQARKFVRLSWNNVKQQNNTFTTFGTETQIYPKVIHEQGISVHVPFESVTKYYSGQIWLRICTSVDMVIIFYFISSTTIDSICWLKAHSCWSARIVTTNTGTLILFPAIADICSYEWTSRNTSSFIPWNKLIFN